MIPARVLRRSHLNHLTLIEGVIRQFDDMRVITATSRHRIEGDMRAVHTREQLATDSPAVTRARPRRPVVHAPLKAVCARK